MRKKFIVLEYLCQVRCFFCYPQAALAYPQWNSRLRASLDILKPLYLRVPSADEKRQ